MTVTAQNAAAVPDNLLHSLVDSLPADSADVNELKAVAGKLSGLFLKRYIKEGTNETHSG